MTTRRARLTGIGVVLVIAVAGSPRDARAERLAQKLLGLLRSATSRPAPPPARVRDEVLFQRVKGNVESSAAARRASKARALEHVPEKVRPDVMYGQHYQLMHLYRLKYPGMATEHAKGRVFDGTVFSLRPVAQESLDFERQFAELTHRGTEYLRNPIYDAIAGAGRLEVDLGSREVKRFVRAAARLRSEPDVRRRIERVFELIDGTRGEGRHPLLGLTLEPESPAVARGHRQPARLSDYLRLGRGGPREQLVLAQLGLQYADVWSNIVSGTESVYARRYMSSFDERPAVWIEVWRGKDEPKLRVLLDPSGEHRVSVDGEGPILSN